jgi:hypothetical protein
MTSASTVRIDSAADQLWLIGRALWDPDDAASRIRDGASVWLPAVLFAAILGVVSWLSIQPRLLVFARANALSLEQVGRAAAEAPQLQVLLAVAPPLALSIKGLVVTALVWLTCVVAGRDLDRRRLFTLVVYASSIFVLQALFAFAVLEMRAPTATALHELQPVTSLSALWPNANRVTAALLESAGIFDVWFFAVLAVGVKRLTDFTMAGAVLAVIPAWACLTAGQVAILFLR